MAPWRIRRAHSRTSLPGGVQVIMAYTVAMAGALVALKAVPATSTALQWVAIAALGFTIYGPQMLIGLTGAELVAPGAVGASQVGGRRQRRRYPGVHGKSAQQHTSNRRCMHMLVRWARPCADKGSHVQAREAPPHPSC
jgi:hypothetical protein